MSTQTYVRRELLIFPYKTAFPQSGDANKSASDLFDPPQFADLGNTSLAFGRTKAGCVTDVLTINSYGCVSKLFRKGNWAILYKSANPSRIGIPEFIGQIERLNISYATDSRGKIIQSNQITIRSWAFVLKCPVAIDMLSINTLMSNTEQDVRTVQEISNPKAGADAITALATAAYSPFEFPAAILSMIGGYSAIALRDANKPYFNITAEDVVEKLPNSCMSLPRLPDFVSDGYIQGDQKYSAQTFSSFLTFAAGVLQKQSEIPQNGIYNSSSDLISKLYLYDTKDTKRPTITNIATTLKSGAPAWDMIGQLNDSHTNEYFCDFFVSKKGDGGYTAHPFLIMRDKPFLLKTFKDKLSGFLKSGWSVYEDVPRIFLPTEYITSIGISSSFTEAPNFFRVHYKSNYGSAISEEIRAILESTYRDGDAMSRYGGAYYAASTEYFDAKNKEFTSEYYLDLSTVIFLQHSQKHRFLNMRLSIKEPEEFALTVGCNLEFSIAGRNFVGQIEGFEKTHSVSSQGAHSANTSIILSYVVMVDPLDSSYFIFVPDEIVRDLFATEYMPYAEALEVSALQNKFEAFRNEISKEPRRRVQRKKVEGLVQ